MSSNPQKLKKKKKKKKKIYIYIYIYMVKLGQLNFLWNQNNFNQSIESVNVMIFRK